MLIDFFGDSITEGVGASSYEKCFVSRVSQLLKCEVINHGIGGTRFAHQSKPSDEPRWDLDFCSRLKELNPNADLVFVFGGTNDFGHGDAPIGNIDDDTPNTFYGACNYIINYLLKLYKIEQITFILPLHRVGEDNPRGDGYKEPPSLVLEGYRNVIKEVLDKMAPFNFAINGQKLLETFFKMLLKNPVKACETLRTNPAFFSPILQETENGKRKLSPSETKKENERIANFFKTYNFQ